MTKQLNFGFIFFSGTSVANATVELNATLCFAKFSTRLYDRASSARYFIECTPKDFANIFQP